MRWRSNAPDSSPCCAAPTTRTPRGTWWLRCVAGSMMPATTARPSSWGRTGTSSDPMTTASPPARPASPCLRPLSSGKQQRVWRTSATSVSAVVVRYFGGILLGAGGLVRAYSESVSAALDRAPMVRRSRLRICSATVPHAAAGRLENDLRAAGFVMAGTSYGAQETILRLAVPDDAAGISSATERVLSLTAGRTGLTPAGTEWIDVPLS